MKVILLLACPDRPGIAHGVYGLIRRQGGNVVDSDQHRDERENAFLMRVEWETKRKGLTEKGVLAGCARIAKLFKAEHQVVFPNRKRRIAVMVTKEAHCLVAIIQAQKLGEINGHIDLVIGNRADLEQTAEREQIPFRHIPIDPEGKPAAERQELELLRTRRIDLVVMARYMQVLSPHFLKHAPSVINIHHAFLPAFPGPSPYARAFDRGVKQIGATAHYATAVLDDGPIITQETTRVGHKDALDDFIRNGRKNECLALVEAVRLHCAGRVIVYGKKTVVFK